MTNATTADGLTSDGPSFWKRQLATAGTEQQAVFDIAFGVIIPVVCFFIDPIVFKGGGLVGPPVLEKYQLFAYAVTAIEVCLFVISMIGGSRLRGARFIGAALIAGALFSFVIGFVILPYTLLGLMIIIGALGFIPFITGFVYLREGWRALKREGQASQASFINALLLGAILSLGAPALLSLYVARTASQSVEIILHGEPQQAELALARLRRLPLIPQQNLEPLVAAYMNEKDPQKKELLRNSYQVITGDDIEIRIRIIND